MQNDNWWDVQPLVNMQKWWNANVWNAESPLNPIFEKGLVKCLT